MSFGAKEGGGFWTLKGGMGDTPTTAMTDRPPAVLKFMEPYVDKLYARDLIN